MSAYRLPTHVRPTHYAIDLDASPRRKSFSGRLVVSARLLERCQSFELNVRDLSVSNVSIAFGKRKRVKARATSHPDRQTVEIAVADPLPKGKVEVTLFFRGKLSEGLNGLYLARDGADKAIVSQCEATDARAIFPCFDEPPYKATFAWTVRTDPGLEVVTNGPLKSKRRSKDRVVWRFEPTRKMSSYLAAVTIGRYESSATQKNGGVPCRVLCGPGKVDLTWLSEAITAQVLPWYREYFGKKYAFAKLDQVAVPGFDAGAMENVGAVFYRQSLLLAQPGAISWMAQKRSAEVIAHEIAHMWFGNLVTMQWWDDLWLNEAFATWVALKAVDAWRPEWRMWDDWLDYKQAALAADALVNTHPIYTEVTSPAEATELFDVITYEKGSAVLRMIESYLGEADFRAGIRDYMKAFAWGNATRRDLWGKLADASEQPVDSLMESWVLQTGYPLVTVATNPRDDGLTLHLKQKRFFANPDATEVSPTTWQIPVVVRYGNAEGVHTERFLLDAPETTVTIQSDAPVRWCFPNADAAGFYRTQLGDRALRAILQTGLKHLSAAERTTLLDDQWALVRSGHSRIDRFLEVLAAFRNERDYVVVRTLAGRLATLDNHLVPDAERPMFATFVRWLLGGRLREVGWEPQPGEPEEQAVLRAAVVQTLGTAGADEDVLDRAEELAARERDDPMAVGADLAGVIVGLSARRAGADRLEHLAATYRERRKRRAAPELQARYLAALGRCEREPAVQRALNLCLDGTVPQEQLRTVLVPLLRTRATGRWTWEFLKSNWTELAPRIGSMSISGLVESTGALPVDLRDDIARFFETHPIAEAKRAVQKALEALDLRRALVERESAHLEAWLRRGPQAYESLLDD